MDYEEVETIYPMVRRLYDQAGHITPLPPDAEFFEVEYEFYEGSDEPACIVHFYRAKKS